MNLRMRTAILMSFLFAACQEKAAVEKSAVKCDASIKYTWDQLNQETRKTAEYFNSVTGSCSEKRLSLSTYEKGLDYRRRNYVECTPQSIPSVWLKTDGNFYSYRNGRIFIELDATTGQFRRISVGVTSDNHSAGAGRSAFSRDLGCFFVRTDQEIEPVNPTDYGQQLLLDLGPNKASSEEVKPSEAFRYTRNGSSWAMTRFDQNYDIDWSFCPESLVPWEFCSALRNGNPYYLPDLDAATEADLLQQALLIRSEYNFTEIAKAEFDTLWGQAEQSYVETPLQAFKYEPLMPVDVPDGVWSDWADYVRGSRPTMPDVGAINLPAFCYPAEKQVIFADGSIGVITGTACHDGNGGYEFQ